MRGIFGYKGLGMPTLAIAIAAAATVAAWAAPWNGASAEDIQWGKEACLIARGKAVEDLASRCRLISDAAKSMATPREDGSKADPEDAKRTKSAASDCVSKEAAARSSHRKAVAGLSETERRAMEALKWRVEAQADSCSSKRAGRAACWASCVKDSAPGDQNAVGSCLASRCPPPEECSYIDACGLGGAEFSPAAR